MYLVWTGAAYIRCSTDEECIAALERYAGLNHRFAVNYLKRKKQDGRYIIG